MVNQSRSLSSTCLKTEFLYPQPQKMCLITSGIGSFPGAGELLDVKEVVKNFETSEMLANDSVVCPNTETSLPISNILDKQDPTICAQSSNDGSNLHPTRMKRLLANRQSAQRARRRKFEYVEELKQDIQIEEAKLSIKAQKLSCHEVEHVILKKEIDKLKEMLKALAIIKLRKEAEYEALQEELMEVARVLNIPPKY